MRLPVGQCPSQSSCLALPFLPAQASPEGAGRPTICSNSSHSACGPLGVPDNPRVLRQGEQGGTYVTGFANVSKVYHRPFPHFSTYLMSGSLWSFICGMGMVLASVSQDWVEDNEYKKSWPRGWHGVQCSPSVLALMIISVQRHWGLQSPGLSKEHSLQQWRQESQRPRSLTLSALMP